MRKLGLLGGIGPESTIPYYHDILYGVQKRVGQAFFPTMTVESLSCFDVMSLAAAGKKEELAAYLLAGIKNLAAAGADFGAMACNTAHLVFDELEKQSPIPLVSILDVTRTRAREAGFRRVGLLGSLGTMNGGFFERSFAPFGIDIVKPSEDEKAYIEEKLLHEVELGQIDPGTQKEFQRIAERMRREDGIEAVILGCTEIPLVFAGVSLSIPMLNTMQIHIEALIDEIMR